MSNLRQAYVSALLTIFLRSRQQLSTVRCDFQIFIVIDADDSSNDALYVHSPNPNLSTFPYFPKPTKWGDTKLELALSRLVPELEIRVGHMRWDDGGAERHHILLYSPAFGVPIEEPIDRQVKPTIKE